MNRSAEPVSKTRRKAMMHALQALGERLVETDPARVATLQLPDALADAIALARRITRREARRRQMQYIGRLMRAVDPAPIEARLAQWERGSADAARQVAACEHWRARLLAEGAALDALVAQHPAADRQTILALVEAARAERAGARPPRAYRQLFRTLFAIVGTAREAGTRTSAAAAESAASRGMAAQED